MLGDQSPRASMPQDRMESATQNFGQEPTRQDQPMLHRVMAGVSIPGKENSKRMFFPLKGSEYRVYFTGGSSFFASCKHSEKEGNYLGSGRARSNFCTIDRLLHSTGFVLCTISPRGSHCNRKWLMSPSSLCFFSLLGCSFTDFERYEKQNSQNSKRRSGEDCDRHSIDGIGMFLLSAIGRVEGATGKCTSMDDDSLLGVPPRERFRVAAQHQCIDKPTVGS